MYKQEQILPFQSAEKKSVQVTRMFNNIAKTYDKINHFTSLGVDRYWRKKLISCVKKARLEVNEGQEKKESILDIATGTGDLAILAAENLSVATITGVDLSEEMMSVGQKKVEKKHLENVISFQKEDATNMSFIDASFDVIITSFGIRNFDNLDKSLLEMRRVLKKGGTLAMLELSEPIFFPMKQLFRIYSHTILPIIGRMIANDKQAYDYLTRSIEAFPQGEKMAKIAEKAGFENVTFKRLTFGICTLYMIKA